MGGLRQFTVQIFGKYVMFKILQTCSKRFIYFYFIYLGVSFDSVCEENAIIVPHLTQVIYGLKTIPL